MRLNLFKFSIVSFLLFIAAYLIYDHYDNRIGYIDSVVVFESFNLKKELEADMLQKEQEFANALNKIKIQLAQVSEEIKVINDADARIKKVNTFNVLRKNLEEQELQYDSEILEVSQIYNDRIWEKLDVFLKEFGMQKNLKVLLGNTGDRNIIYAKEAIDVTQECITYVNNRYEGHEI